MAQHHGHDHAPGNGSGSFRLLAFALLVTLGFAAVEAVAGVWAGSLALMSDAAHMVSDAAALGVGAVAAWLSTRPPSRRHSYGLERAEVLGALFNALFMVVLVVAIAYSALQRLADPPPVMGAAVVAVAALGLGLNLLVAWMLHRGEQNLNVRGALLHVIGDLLGSVAALSAGAVIWLTGWTRVDPLLSLLIAGLILVSALRLLREVVHVLMEGVPLDLELPEIGHELASIEGVLEVHDLHVWSLGSRAPQLTAHLVLADPGRWPGILAVARDLLQRHHGISHATLQPELRGRVQVLPLETAQASGAAAS